MTDISDAIDMMNASEIMMTELFGDPKHNKHMSVVGEVTEEEYNVLMNAFGVTNRNNKNK